MPALALLRRLLSGSEQRRGATACVGLLSVADILAESAGLALHVQLWSTSREPLFQRVLGADFARLPARLRELHSPRGTTHFQGLADIDAGSNVLARLAARLLRFPAAAAQVPVTVTIEPHVHGETWRRCFGNRSFSSLLECTGAARPCTESFGPIRCTLRVTADAQCLNIDIDAAYLGPVPLPRWLTPWTRAREHVDAQGRFNFDVEIGLPLLGRLVRYRGWLTHG